MDDQAELIARLRREAGPSLRFVLGIAGAPGAGKSTFSAQLRDALTAAGESAVVVPMDGFHFDDAVLNARGHRARKGAPHTFDVAGFEVLLKRIKAREADIAIPVFDRAMELARAGAEIISAEVKFVLVEGNYLLLKQGPWARLKALFDFTIFLSVPEVELEKRLVARWLGLGLDASHARERALGNDIPNAKTVVLESDTADFVLSF